MAASEENPHVGRFRRKYGGDEGLRREIAALFDVLSAALGSEKVVLRAGKLGTLKQMRSTAIPDRLLALQRLVFEDPTIEKVPARPQYRKIIGEIEDALADLVAQRNVEENLERKINAKMLVRHHEYLRDLKLEALREEARPGNAGHAAQARRSQRARRPQAQYGRTRRAAAARAGRSSVRVGDPGAAREDGVAVSAARHPVRAARRREDDRCALGARARQSPAARAVRGRRALRRSQRHDAALDHRETTNPLLGSVHDPIYQGSRREFAEGGIPEPKLGLVTRAHGGVLFIDEIGEMDATMQTKLLKVLEDKRVTFESSYYDEHDPGVPAYVKKLFADGAPADFILIGATTRDPDAIDAAIRSRCAAVYFEPLTQAASHPNRQGSRRTARARGSLKRSRR